MSFYTSLSGLQAAQIDLASIANNLANVSTNGFKKSRTEFADVIASNPSVDPTQAVGLGTVVKANRQQFSQGNLVQSQNALDLAISGDGFFAVKPHLDSSEINFTRNGAFLVDANRYVVDGQGDFVQVYPVDGSGAVVATGLDQAISLRLPATNGTPAPTKNIALTVNLPGAAAVSNPVFDRFDPSTYSESTTTTIFDADGNPETLTNYFRRDTVVQGSPPTSDWSVFSFVGNYQLQQNGATNPITLTFDSNGKLVSPTSPQTFDGFTPVNSPTDQVLTLDFGTQTAQQPGSFNVTKRTQDGKAIGQLQGVTVDQAGLVKASFSNGVSQVLGTIVITKFSNPSGLRQLGDSNWSVTGLSGDPLPGQPGQNGFGSLLTGTIERSNVDITEELVALIAAQRNFQANSKALETDKQIAQTILNIQ